MGVVSRVSRLSRWTMDQPTLFELPPQPAPQAEPAVAGQPRLRVAERHQVIMRTLALDQMLPADDDARMVWAFVAQCDLSPLYARIAAVEGSVGRDATDPQILLALWLLATIKGVGSARELDRLCERHLAYQWICGEVTVNHNLLSAFRGENRDFLDGLLTQQVAALMQAGVTVERIAQDGARTRASAGKASFERRETLEESLREAEQLVKKLVAELDEDPAAASRREKAAKKRAAEERVERVNRVLPTISPDGASIVTKG